MAIPTADVVDIRWHPQRGNTAFASSSFDAGDIIVEEEAILTILAPFTDPEEMIPFQMFAEMTRVDQEFWLPLHASWKLSASTMKALIIHLYSPLSDAEPLTNRPSDILSLRHSHTEEAAVFYLFSDEKSYELLFPKDRCLSRDFWDEQRMKIMSGYSPPNNVSSSKAIFDVCSFLHACRINIHSNGSQGISVVLPTCCKFSHSCNPNTIWKLSIVKKACGDAVVVGKHIAIRSVKKGEELTFSYIGNGLNLLGDTRTRRESLLPLHFLCRCSMCSRYDDGDEISRRLPCKVCKRKGTVRLCPDTLVWECVSCEGYQHITAHVEVGSIVKMETFLHKIVFVCLFGAHDEDSSGSSDKNRIDPVIREIILHNFLFESEILMEGDIKQYHQQKEDDAFQVQVGFLEPWIVFTSHKYINPLIKRWRIVNAILHYLGPEHYLFIISLITLLKNIRTAICACIISRPAAVAHDWRDFLSKIRLTERKDMGKCWIDDLLRWIILGDAWFISNQLTMSLQRMTFWRCYGDLIGLWTAELSRIKDHVGFDEEISAIKAATSEFTLHTSTEDISLSLAREAITALKLPKLRRWQEFDSIVRSILQEIGSEVVSDDILPW